jgi:hypothetical protein
VTRTAGVESVECDVGFDLAGKENSLSGKGALRRPRVLHHFLRLPFG